MDQELELPPGFRFYPTEEELISFYLHHKLQSSRPELDRVIPVIDIYCLEPWELPMVTGKNDEEQWFFFTAQQEREARGGKPNRTTATGYWKATGSPGYVFSTTQVQKSAIGVKKTMVFYKGRAPLGRKTPWKMNEYKAIQFDHASSSNAASPIPKLRHEMSVCRVYITSGSSRAFDRRPFGAAIPTSLQPPPVHHQPPLQMQSDPVMTTTTTTTTTTTMNVAVAMEKSSSSTDSSRSGGGGGGDESKDHQGSSSRNPNYMNDDDEMLITSGLQPLWEWEQLNWP